MLKLKLNYERIADRSRLSGLLPGRMKVVGNSRLITGRAVDVTAQGMGILSSDYLREGDHVILTTGEHTIHLSVIYKRRDYAKSNRFRYGLILCDKHNTQSWDLLDVFAESGCLIQT